MGRAETLNWIIRLPGGNTSPSSENQVCLKNNSQNTLSFCSWTQWLLTCSCKVDDILKHQPLLSVWVQRYSKVWKHQNNLYSYFPLQLIMRESLEAITLKTCTWDVVASTWIWGLGKRLQHQSCVLTCVSPQKSFRQMWIETGIVA